MWPWCLRGCAISDIESTTATEPGIVDLVPIVASLPLESRNLFYRIFHVDRYMACLSHPPEMHPWIIQQFGSEEAVRVQKLVKVTNRVTGEGTLFNELRASRPMEESERLKMEALIIDESKNDPLNEPEKYTPEDSFGRIRGKYSITAANVAKYDELHAIVIFDHHNPLHFDEERIIDYLDTGWRWAQRAHQEEPEAKYYLFIWNCLWKAGASLHHGHAQVMLARGRHYAKIEALRAAAESYRKQYGASYFDDLYEAHRMVGCGFEVEGVRIMAYLTPIKEKEIMLLSPEFNLSLKQRTYEMLSCLRDSFQVLSFNMALITPPLAPTEESWEGFPVMTRIVDRGDPRSRASDVAAMELYAASVVASDPLRLARMTKGRCFLGQH